MSQYSVLSPFHEASAYEALWDEPKASFPSISKQFFDYPKCLPSDLASPESIKAHKQYLLPLLKKLPNSGIRVDGDGMFPTKLRDARHAPKVLYYQGNWDLIYLPSVAVVGTRKPTLLGIERTRKLVKCLIEDKFVIVSGLAKGIDTAAHKMAITEAGTTMAVIGTPLNQFYPPENANLQETIAKDFLLISQVPFARYANQTYRENRFFFPARNIVMSALSQATIIVEAGETSGTLVQAHAALQQGRKLIILENNFQNPALTWPKKFELKGALRAKNYAEIRRYLTSTSKTTR